MAMAKTRIAHRVTRHLPGINRPPDGIYLYFDWLGNDVDRQNSDSTKVLPTKDKGV